MSWSRPLGDRLQLTGPRACQGNCMDTLSQDGGGPSQVCSVPRFGDMDAKAR